MTGGPRPGATWRMDGRCTFRLWAPELAAVELHLLAPTDRLVPMTALGDGYFEATVADVPPGSRYKYRFPDGAEWPDPASAGQPDGVHGPSEVVPTRYPWTDDNWAGVEMRDLVLYELHVGTFSPTGDFDGVIGQLAHLRDLGVTAVELMPVAPFPGARNWGYDGVFPLAVHEAYGGPVGLKRLVDACHGAGLAVVLDVVYNHLGPEGNYLPLYGPYFSDRYRTGWGEAVNVDGPESDGVRDLFIASARRWIGEFHLDGLRLDAVHAIFDISADPFLAELTRAVHEEAARHGRKAVVIAESDRNDPRLIRPVESGGLGLDGQWSDEFHHALHVVLTGETSGYYVDFSLATGRSPLAMLATAWREAYIYTGQRSIHQRRRHGASALGLPGERFIVCTQNHDQIGNRMLGDRLTALLPPAALKVAAASVLLSPFVPLLFMGEEYGEPAPFQYFVSHTDPDLVEAVRAGRRAEFAAFGWTDGVPDPQAEATFEASRLNWSLRDREPHRSMLAFYTEALRLRRTHPALGVGSDPSADEVRVFEPERALVVWRRAETGEPVVIVLSFNPDLVTLPLDLPAGSWRVALDSSDPVFGGPGATLPTPFSTDGQPLTLHLSPFTALLLTNASSTSSRNAL